MKVADILKSKGSFVYSLTANASVFEALKMMAEKNIGALMIIEEEKLLGIFSERDYARKIVLQGKASNITPVKEIMTKSVITVLPEDSLEQCMTLMSKNKIRHLPVLNNEKVIGIISLLALFGVGVVSGGDDELAAVGSAERAGKSILRRLDSFKDFTAFTDPHRFAPERVGAPHGTFTV